MGALCSRTDSEHDEGEKVNAIAMVHSLQQRQNGRNVANLARHRQDDMVAARSLIDAHDASIASLNSSQRLTRSRDIRNFGRFRSVEDYLSKRERLVQQERTLDFDYRCRAGSTREEQQADAIIQRLRAEDKAEVYDAAPARRGYGGQQHPRFPGDHFLSNRELINRTRLFQVASDMPKGAHLHIHFNACLLPHVLLDIAKGMDRMFITSDIPLVSDDDFESFNKCEIQFSIMSQDKENPGDIFLKGYQARQTMPFKEFLLRFPTHYGKASADEWLLDKLVFDEEEAHNYLQTASGYVKHVL